MIHPIHDLAWRKREKTRTAFLACRFAAGIAAFSRISFAFEQLGMLMPVPWLLPAPAAVLPMPVYAAYVGSTLPIVRTDPAPPPRQREGDA